MAKSRFASILSNRCPRCRSGSLFVEPYSWANAYKMKTACYVCDQNYEPEPGFYYGAMFISYILTAWLFIIVGFTLAFGLGWTVMQTLVAVAILTVVIHNFMFRFSRSLWLHFFVKFDPKATQEGAQGSYQK